MNKASRRIENGQVDIALWYPEVARSGGMEFILPDFPHLSRDALVVAVPVPRGHDEGSQLPDDDRVYERGPTDLRGRRSAVARNDVTILGVDDDEKDGTALLLRSFQSLFQ